MPSCLRGASDDSPEFLIARFAEMHQLDTGTYCLINYTKSICRVALREKRWKFSR